MKIKVLLGMNDENIQLFCKVLRIRGCSESSIANYMSSIYKYIKINDLNFEDDLLIEYFNEMRNHEYSSSTIRMALMAIKLYLKLIEERDFRNLFLISCT